ncbi:hypothetical protein FKM82_014608 [Ascaphus truei]
MGIWNVWETRSKEKGYRPVPVCLDTAEKKRRIKHACLLLIGSLQLDSDIVVEWLRTANHSMDSLVRFVPKIECCFQNEYLTFMHCYNVGK